MGFRRVILDYKEDMRKGGESKYHFWKMMKLALAGIISFSNFPLRISVYAGTIISLFSFVYASWIVYHKIIYGAPAGLSSIMVGVFFIGGLQLIFMGIVGEYISFIFTEVKRRPLYCVGEIIGRKEKDISDGN